MKRRSWAKVAEALPFRATTPTRLAHGHGQVLGVLHVLGHRPCTRHGGGPRIAKVLPGEHRLDTRRGERAACVDRRDTGVRFSTTDHREVTGTRNDEVVDVAGFPGEQLRILLAEHRRTDDRAHEVTDPLAAASTAFTMLW